MQLLLQTFKPQTSSQSYSTRRLLNKCKTTQLIYIERYELIQPCHNRIQTPHHNHVQRNQVGNPPCILQILHIAKRFAYPTIEAKISTMLLLTRTLDAIFIRPPNTSSSATLQRRNLVSERKELSQVSLFVESRTWLQQEMQEEARTTTRAVKGGLTVMGMSMICAYVSRSWSGKSKSNSSNSLC